MNTNGASCQEIAIIGSGCRFPGRTNSPSKLWDLVRDPYQLAEPIPLDRFSLEGFYHESGQYHGHFNVKEAYFLAGEGVHRRFDASFFGMNPAEAMCLDPQCRLLLETVYEALEAAGLTVESLQGSDTAVYTGQMVADYDQIMMRDSDDSVGTYHASGTSHAILSNRISYFFDWHGPSMTIDTACSSSLVALHQAVQQLRAGHSRVAIAAGANLLMDPKCFISLSSLNMLSPDGGSRMWDADAKGYARGEGVAAIVLKTLAAALEDGDDIECIIRETGFGQDGKTQGITSPSHAAQTQLIRDCYSRAGLDLANPADRPQFFECHGTGTLAGDAAEAEAISSAFFPNTVNAGTNSSGYPQRLVVGSIKSIIGHTEGTAGLAGILKASLALQNATLPPNLLFNRLNPRIEPFYNHLKLSVTSTPWPSVLHGGPRRASVNSFGFGGANVHAILESYEPCDLTPSPGTSPTVAVFTPFVFSAFSETSLIANLEGFHEYLQNNLDSVNLRDLAYTLHSRRTDFQVTTVIAASSVEHLIRKVAQIKDADKPAITRVPRRKTSQFGGPRFLGIFTGQGAQFAGMGVELLKSSKIASQVIERLETRLLQLPIADRPKWSLMQELEKEPSSSRIGEATLSQPLCTAVQILQVDLLRAAGIDFDAVVGHSSGEIGAAYAAGFISAEDAICIAYYRGLHSKLASGPDGKPGAMMAIGTSAEDMQEICDDPDFQGRVCIAAVNSPVSVTLSGDRDAIEELKVILDDEKKFARLLKVDKAYHSHHMLPCSEAYLNSMAALDIPVDNGGRSIWFSSVLNGEDMSGRHELLKGTYWDSNMISPVLLEKAITNAYTVLGPFDCALEVGPHPALKGPALQTIQEISGSELPYTGLFRRDTSAIESVAEGLGYVWSCLGKDAIDLQKYDRYVSGDSPCRLVKGLPTYAWDWDEYWNESRYAKAIRLRPGPVHELLGHMTPDSNEQDMRWRHVLKPIEIPWLLGHRLQNQIVFPGAGYVVTALEAAMAMCKQKRVSASLIELSDVEFGRALVFDDDNSNVEVVTSLAGIVHRGPGLIEASFRYHAADGKVDSSLKLMATAQVHISLGEPLNEALPARAPKPTNLLKVRPDDFYAASRDLEYQWAGPFVALDKLERKLGDTVGVLNIVEPSGLLLHPALLDAAFQGVLLAYSFPDDGQLWTIHVPGKIERLTINPSLCARETGKGKPLSFASSHHPEEVRMIGNVDVFPSDPDLENAIFQVEGVECFPLSRASAQDDKEAFATVVWDVASPDPRLAIATDSPVMEEERELAGQLERMAGFYVRKLVREAPADHSSLSEGPYARLRFATEVISSARAGHISLWRPEWENDTYKQLVSACQPFAQTVEMQLLRLVGDSLPNMFEADESPIELDSTLAEQFYSDALGLRIGNRRLARTVKQLTHRYSHLDILQIGAGTGAATKAIFHEIGSTFSSYTFTDMSSSPIESAKPWAAPHLHKMVFKTLDIRQDPVTQGFVEQSYDLVVASLGLYSSAVLKQTLQNARRLLKPGGYLIMLELLPVKSSVYPLILGAIPGLWQGADEGRALSPAMSLSDWDQLLQGSGFSGCDTSTPTVLEQGCITPFTVLLSQAMDGKTTFLRSPLKSESDEFFKPGTLIEDLVIIGGASLEVARLIEQITDLVQNHCGNIRVIRTLPDLSPLKISSKTTVLSLTELEDPIFQHLGHEQWEALKEMTMTAGILLWTTQGRRAKNPFANIMAGLMRSVIREVPTISYQMLDYEDEGRIDAYGLSEALLRLQAEIVWQRQDKTRTSIENELVLDGEARITIPRLIINKEMNDRYNSSKRTIIDRFDSCQQNIRVAPINTQSGYELMQEPAPSFEDGTGVARMEVTLSLLSAIRVAEFGCMFLKLGKQGASENHLIALSNKHSSITNSWDCPSVKVDLKKSSTILFFSLVVHHLLASVLLRSLSRGDVVLVLEPEPGFATILANDARLIGVNVMFVTASLTEETPRGDLDWLNIHPSTPDRMLSRLLPTGISVLVDFANGKESGSVSSRIRSLLSTHCRTDSTKTLFTDEAWAPPSSQIDEIQKRLQNAVARATRTVAETNEKVDNLILPIIQPNSLAEARNRPVPFSLVDWTGCSDVPVRIRSIDTQISFSSQKTYWFAGLSGGLGIALCEWMARHGANYFVISSRNPKITDSWSKTMYELGVVVKIASCDVTIRDQVVALHTEICTTMPPIAGVIQGSMVLEDTAIRAMTLDNFLRGTKPKVEGSLYLNELFQENTLDFFVFFSSIVSVIGRPGQSNYSAANAFMTSLAEQRRRRGLAASIIHIGPIYGIGYAAQLEKPIYSKAAFRSTAMIPTSERDFYQLFAEAVIAGRPGSSWNTIELFSGARRINKYDVDRPVWEAEPLMSHFVRNSDEFSQATAESESRVPLGTQLARANDRGQIYNIVRDAFLPKLYSLFQLDPSKVAKETLVGMRLDEMGIDSLLAVEIRGWFMKTLEANIPVLKILSGVPIGDLITMATDKIPDRLVPNLEPNQDAKHEVDGPDLATPHRSLEEPESDRSSTPDSSDLSIASAVALSTSDTSDEPSSVESIQSLSWKTFRLSFSQETFWFVWAFLKDKTSLNHTAWARITGRIRIPDFQRALRSLVRQHEILRTCIIEQNGKPMQAVMETGALHLEVAQVDEEEDVHRAVELLQDHHVYDVARGETIRCMLLSMSPEQHYFVAGLHPLVADGMSFQSLITGVQQLYASPNHDQSYKAHQFSYYSEKQHADFATGKFDGELQFWKAEMAMFPPPLPILTLSRATSRPALIVYENERAVVRVSAELKGKIQAICRRYRVTPFHFYLAAFRVLLLRYSPVGDGEDAAIGIGDGNRTESEMMDVIGPFVNFLAVRLRTQPSAIFSHLLQDVRDKAYAALAHSKVPFQVLLNELNVPRSTSHTPLFQSFVNYRQGLLKTTHWGKGDDNLALHSVEIGISKMAYDVTLEILDYADGECVQTLAVRKDLYSLAEVQKLAKSYERLMEAFVADPNLLLDGPDLFAPAEVQEVLRFSRGPSWPSQWPETVVHRVDQIALSQPQEIAVRCGNISSTYAEVLALANAVTAALQRANVAIVSPVAVLVEPSSAWISSLLGIMRAGAVYLPLDLSLPWARLAAMVHDCQPNIILVDKDSKQYVSKLKRSGMQVIDVSSIERQDESTAISASTDGPAVILYTSGSSGKPKGIVLRHEGLRNWTEPIARSFNLGREVVLQQTSPTFDLSLIQVFTALCFGGSLCLTLRQQRGDAEAISKIIADQGVTFAGATPSEYATWLHYGKRNLHSSAAWKTAICAGEPVPLSLVEQFASLGRTDLTVYNVYGPTETSFTCTATQVSLHTSCGPIAAGRPLPNYSVFVVDDQLRPVPVGMQGEIYIGGPGVGLGYLNQPELTSARFVPNVLDKPKDDAWSGKTLHRTGDLGRWREDGQLLVEGRIDTQVKLRGLRIDLAEVEHAILDVADGELCEAVVSVRRSALDEPEFLVAHVVFAHDDDNRQHQGVIQSRLSKRLPKYMCPAAFVSLDKMPTTTSGKLDRRLVAELPLPSDENRLGDDEEKEQFVTLTDTETRLKTIWEEILGLRCRITVQTDFFHVGGSSLLLLGLEARIRETFNCAMPLVHMFESSTLGAMANQIDHGLSYDVEVDAIDWDKETALSPELLDLDIKTAYSSTHLSPKRNVRSKVVVLTGVTGQLGRALLDTLVAEPLIDHVHCIGVRNTRNRPDMAALDKNKVTIHEGDLVLPDLGLSKGDAAAVFGAADVVIHNGADMSYLKTYASLRAANLQSTKDLVKMIARHSNQRTVPFHYVSTVSVGNIVATALENGGNITDGRSDVGSGPGASDAQDIEKGGLVFRPVSIAAYPPPSIVSSSEIARTAHGYVATKWASEVFLEHLHERYPEWPVVIHRPSLIARQTPEAPSSSQSKEEVGGARLEFVENLRRYSSLLCAVPAAPAIADKRVSISGAFDVVPLNDVVKEMVDSLRGSLTDVREEMVVEGVRIFHHIGGVELPLDDFRNLVAKNEHGEDIREMDVVEWARKAGELGMHPTMVALFESLAAAEGRLVFPRLAR